MHSAHLVLVAMIHALIAPCMESIVPLDFTIEYIRCNREWDRTSSSYSGKLDDKYPLTSRVSFSGYQYSSEPKREFALERCFNKEKHCIRVSRWYPSCSNSCGNPHPGSPYEGVIHFDYKENGITEFHMNHTDAHFEGNIYAMAITYRIMEKVLVAGGNFEETEERVGRWSISKAMMDSCRKAMMERKLESVIASIEDMSSQMQKQQKLLDRLGQKIQFQDRVVKDLVELQIPDLKERTETCQSKWAWKIHPCGQFRLNEKEAVLMPLRYGCKASPRSNGDPDISNYCWRQEYVGSDTECWGKIFKRYTPCHTASDCTSMNMTCY